MNRDASKSSTCAAICEGKSEASKRVIVSTAMRPSKSESQKAVFPIPSGATIPTPVTTTRFLAIRAALGNAFDARKRSAGYAFDEKLRDDVSFDDAPREGKAEHDVVHD